MDFRYDGMFEHLCPVGLDHKGYDQVKQQYEAKPLQDSGDTLVIKADNNKKVMGEFTNGRWSNILGALAFFLMAISAIALVYFQFK